MSGLAATEHDFRLFAFDRSHDNFGSVAILLYVDEGPYPHENLDAIGEGLRIFVIGITHTRHCDRKRSGQSPRAALRACFETAALLASPSGCFFPH